MSERCTVNGRPFAVEPAETVSRLLARLGVAGEYALVERNGEPVARERFGIEPVVAGDTLIVARPVAGG